ncbi:hypothetical protein ACJX0J_020151, partial [Zea mays]
VGVVVNLVTSVDFLFGENPSAAFVVGGDMNNLPLLLAIVIEAILGMLAGDLPIFQEVDVLAQDDLATLGISDVDAAETPMGAILVAEPSVDVKIPMGMGASSIFPVDEEDVKDGFLVGSI